MVSSVTTADGGASKIFDGAKLIAGKIVHYQGGGGYRWRFERVWILPVRIERNSWGRSLALGLPNPGAAATPEAGALGPGVAVRFDSPVVNRKGADLVFFEMHKGSGGGDCFHIGPLEAKTGAAWDYRCGLRYSGPHMWPGSRYRGWGLYIHTKSPKDTETFLGGGIADSRSVRKRVPRHRHGHRPVRDGCKRGGGGLPAWCFDRSPASRRSIRWAILGLPTPTKENLLAKGARAAASQAV